MADSSYKSTPGKAKKKRVGRTCVAGAPNNISCQNNQGTPGISFHSFPSDKRRPEWIRFVQRHRPGWQPTASSVLCSAHFHPEAYTQPPNYISLGDNDSEVRTKAWLNKRTAVPTIDAVEIHRKNPPVTDRERRQLLRNVAIGVEAATTDEPDLVSPDLVSPDLVSPDLVSPEEVRAVVEPEDIPLASSQPSHSTYTSGPPTSCEACKEKTESLLRMQDTFRKSKRRREQLKMEVKELRLLNKTLQQGEKLSQSESSDSENDDQKQSTCSEESEGDESEGEELEGGNSPKGQDYQWAQQEEEASEAESEQENREKKQSRNKIRVDPETPCEEEPKFIVSYSALLTLFSMFCFNCKTGTPKVEMEKNGTMVTITQHCSSCKGEPFKWRSQPLIMGKYPVCNIMLSFAVLMAGASINKVLLVLKHMRLSAYQSRTYFYHQSRFIFPVVLQHWQSYSSSLIDSLKSVNYISWCGDGRFDSMGHSAKYGAYTMYCASIGKIVHFELLQANECENSNSMELEGAKRCFSSLLPHTKISEFISDRHRGISKWMRNTHPDVKHFFDIWHIVKSVIKKMLKASKEKGCEIISNWSRAVRNHIYWCATSTQAGFQKLILAKWTSFFRHVADEHTNHPNDLYKQCKHDKDIDEREWIKEGTKAYEKLHGIVNNTRLLNDMKMISSDAQTSCLEGFHSTLNQWHPKMLHFSWLGTYCRHILASLHFNENLKRETKVTKAGKKYYNVCYPKYKLGQEVVREVAVPHTYGYVDIMRKLLFSLTKEDMDITRISYKDAIPEPLNRKFTNRASKTDALKNYQERKAKVPTLFPEAEQQNCLLASSSNQTADDNPQSGTQTIRKCKKCKNPMKGHPRGHCPP